MYDNLNLKGLTQNASTDSPSTVSQTYNLVTPGDDITHTWMGDIVRIKRPAGLSNVSAVKFRSFKGEMLPYTKLSLPNLKCEIKARVFNMTSVELLGEYNPYTAAIVPILPGLSNSILSFNKAWSYNEGEDSQIIYNVKECMQIASDRMNTIFPISDGGQRWKNTADWQHTFNYKVHLARLNAGSTPLGLISKNSPEVELYNGKTTFPFESYMNVAAGTQGSSPWALMSCHGNYNQSIVFTHEKNYYYGTDPSWQSMGLRIHFNPRIGTDDYYAYSNNNNLEEVDAIDWGQKRVLNGCYAVLYDSNANKSYNAMLRGRWNGWASDELRKMALYIAQSTATDEYYKIVIDWLLFATTMLDGLYMFPNALAMGMVYDSDVSSNVLYMLVASPRDATLGQSLVKYVFVKVEIDIVNQTTGLMSMLGELDTNTGAYMESLAYLYQNGADVGEMEIENTVEDGHNIEYYNFGFKYIVRRDDDTGEIAIRQIWSNIWDVNGDHDHLIYAVESFNGQGLYACQIEDATNTPAYVFEHGGLDSTGLTQLSPYKHFYYMIVDRDLTQLDDPYAFTTKAWVRNMMDEDAQWNVGVWEDPTKYTLGVNNEPDTVKGIDPSIILSMTLNSSTPSASIVNTLQLGGVDYATVPSSYNGFYTTTDLQMTDVISGHLSRPTVILKDSSNNYYQVSFMLRIYTDPFYIEIYTDLKDYENVNTWAYSINMGPVDIVFHQVNPEILARLETLILLQYEFNDLLLRCSTFPNIDNMVFSINESAFIDFKTMGVDSTISELLITLEDSKGEKVDRETLARLYGTLNLAVDWEG